MANYYGMCRTNYFAVTDDVAIDKAREMLGNLEYNTQIDY